MTRCCVPNCSETATHHFPKDKKIMKLWLRAIRRIDFIPKSGSRLCRKHFKDSDFIQISKYTGVSHQHKFLKKSAVPSIFSWHRKPGSKQVEAREERVKIRNYRKSLFQEVPTTSSVPFQEQREESAGISYTIDIPGAETLVPISSDVVKQDKQITQGTQTSNILRLFSTELLLTDNESVLFYTGLETYSKFSLVLSSLLPMAYEIKYRWSRVIGLSIENQFFRIPQLISRLKKKFVY